MTAGNVDSALRLEEEFRTPGDGDWLEPGSGTQITELNLQNQLEEQRDPNNPSPIDQLEGNLEGAVSIDTSLTAAPDGPTPVFHALLFDDGVLPTSGGRAPSAEIAVGLDYIGGTAERLLKGAILTGVDLEWQQGQQWTVSHTFLYADEELNTEFTPTDVQTADSADIYNFAGTDVDVDAVAVEGLSSLSISLDGLARFRRGTSRKAYEAVIGPITATVDLQADFTDESPGHLEAAYGDAEGPIDVGELEAVPITVDLESRSGETYGYEIGNAKPDTYDWQDLTEADSDEQETITFQAFDGDGAGMIEAV